MERQLGLSARNLSTGFLPVWVPLGLKRASTTTSLKRLFAAPTGFSSTFGHEMEVAGSVTSSPRPGFQVENGRRGPGGEVTLGGSGEGMPSLGCAYLLLDRNFESVYFETRGVTASC
jgi:hypothetical protein